ncbi:MAG TPA: protease/transporter [Micromonosporaceae bacterium]|nr:protease/transporter [Micromonosporaceae bacterium]
MSQRRWLLIALFLLFWILPGGAASAAQGQAVLAARVAGPITPVIADHLTEGVGKAEREGFQAYLVELDTPGGLDTSMRKIIQGFLGSKVPVIVYVTPSGGRAASAGALITFSAHVAAMAPGTTIGAATPVDLQGGEISDKVINDAAAYARSIASQRGRNVTFAEETVRAGRAVTADEAVELKAVDLIAPDRATLLNLIDGKEVKLADGNSVTLQTRDVQVVGHDLGPFRSLLQLLADPNLAFLFLSLGTLAIIYELANPGHLVSGTVGVILLVLAFVALSVLPINVAGIALLLLGLALFAAELYAPGVGVFAVAGAVSMLVGGLLLFQGPFQVSLGVLLPAVIVVAAAAVFAGRLAWRARSRPPVTGRELFIGRETSVRRVDGEVARVLLEGAWWNARSPDHQLREGQVVRVIDIQDLDLIVEPAEEAGDE